MWVGVCECDVIAGLVLQLHSGVQQGPISIPGWIVVQGIPLARGAEGIQMLAALKLRGAY